MKYFKDKNDKLYAFEEDGSQDSYIKDGMIQITKKEVDEINAKKDEEMFSAMSYSERRELEYPPFTDYLDGIVKDDKEQIESYIAACKAIKKKYPKG